MNKRDAVLTLLEPGSDPRPVPAAFFLHYGEAYQRGQAAVDRHLEYFRHTGMDFVKVQYEQLQPPYPPIRKPEDWTQNTCNHLQKRALPCSIVSHHAEYFTPVNIQTDIV